jgi:hypothetical protein
MQRRADVAKFLEPSPQRSNAVTGFPHADANRKRPTDNIPCSGPLLPDARQMLRILSGLEGEAA